MALWDDAPDGPEARAARTGRWVSGLGHAGLLVWAVAAGALLRPTDTPPVQMTEVATMSAAEFEAMAAAARGAGPVAPSVAGGVAAPDPQLPPAEASGAPAPAEAPPTATVGALPPPPNGEPVPDLAGAAPPVAPVGVTETLPQVAPPPDPVADALAEAVAEGTAPTASLAPPAPVAETGEAPPAVPETPRSPLALDRVRVPGARPEGLVENYQARVAEAEAARLAAEAEAAAQAEAARVAAAQAEAERQAAEQAAQAEQERVATEAAAQAERDGIAAEEAAQAERDRLAAEAQAEQDRLAAEVAQAEQDRLAEEAAQAERDRIAAEEAQAERDRIAAEEAAQAERDRIAAEQAATPPSVDQDALAQALAEAVGQPVPEAPPADPGGAVPPDTEGGQGGLSPELQAALDEAARLEMEVADAEAAAAVGAAQNEPGGDALAAGLDQALGVPGAEQVAGGPPLTAAEREGFRLAIKDCWNIGALSMEGAKTTVSIRFSMGPDGMPDPATMRLMGHSGGSPAGAQQAFEVGRRAIIGCAKGGYPLPPQKYARWKDVIVDFRPDGPAVN